jgi:hypothetical protein
VRLATLGATPGHRPRTYTPASSKKATIVATLIEANQNSNSPNDPTEMRFVRVSHSSNAKLMNHVGWLGNHGRGQRVTSAVRLAVRCSVRDASINHPARITHKS